MEQYLRAFLEFLELNRNVSRHTVRAYGSDLSQFLAFAAAQLERPLTPGDFDHRLVRAFLGTLYDRKQSRASSARKLAAIRVTRRRPTILVIHRQPLPRLRLAKQKCPPATQATIPWERKRARPFPP